MRKAVKKRNLGLDAKLRFLADVGFFSSRTINRFTVVRNRIEHDFQRPDIRDLEALFDLVSAFVAILQTPMTPGFEDHMDFSLHFQAPEERQGNFSIADNGKAKKFVAEWWLDTDPPQEGKLEASFANPEDFAYFFRVLLLLNQFYSFASYEHIRARLQA